MLKFSVGDLVVVAHNSTTIKEGIAGLPALVVECLGIAEGLDRDRAPRGWASTYKVIVDGRKRVLFFPELDAE